MTPCPYLINRVMEVMEAAFDPEYREAWNRRQVSDALSMPSTHALVIDQHGDPITGEPSLSDNRQPAGFILTRHAADEEELLLIGVLPNHRQRGLGRTLIGLLLEEAKSRGVKQIFLEMREGNSALRLYDQVGFKPVGRRTKYYRLASGSMVDAITFRLEM